MKNFFTGKNSQIGQYLSNDLDFVSYNNADPATWDFLNQTKNLFMIVPKTANTFEDTKKFILAAREAKVNHIVKIGSLGPWRVVHNQLSQFIQDSGIVCSNINIAPLMSNIFTEQYQNQNLYNYRYHAPAPYLDPLALAKLIEKLMKIDFPVSQNISATGKRQYYITDIRSILEKNGYSVKSIVDVHNDNLHNNLSLTPDQKLMTLLGDDYSKGHYPRISDDLHNLGIYNRTFEEFVAQDKHHYLKQFDEDKNL